MKIQHFDWSKSNVIISDRERYGGRDMTILLFLENLVSVWNRDFVLLNLVFNLQDYVFLMKFQNFNINLIFSFLWSRIPSFTTNSSFTYNLVFLFHVGNESNVVWIRPVATRRHRSDYGLIAMVTSWPRLFISLARHVMSSVCPWGRSLLI